MKRCLALLPVLLGLAACATPQYRTAQQECTPEAMRQYPIVNVMQPVTRTRAVQVPTGESRCTTVQTGNVSKTNCQQVMRTEYRSYQEMALIDVNDPGRSAMVNACAAQLCQQRYGNADCEPKK